LLHAYCAFSQKLTKLCYQEQAATYCLTTDEDTGYHVRTQCKKTALVVIDLQEGILPFAGGPHRLTTWSAAPLAWRKNAVPAVRRLSWFASAGRRISPKR
jgi:hypothetical protein